MPEHPLPRPSLSQQPLSGPARPEEIFADLKKPEPAKHAPARRQSPFPPGSGPAMAGWRRRATAGSPSMPIPSRAGCPIGCASPPAAAAIPNSPGWPTGRSGRSSPPWSRPCLAPSISAAGGAAGARTAALASPPAWSNRPASSGCTTGGATPSSGCSASASTCAPSPRRRAISSSRTIRGAARSKTLRPVSFSSARALAIPAMSGASAASCAPGRRRPRPGRPDHRMITKVSSAVDRDHGP